MLYDTGNFCLNHSRSWLQPCSAPSQSTDQSWNIVNLILEIKHRANLASKYDAFTKVHLIDSLQNIGHSGRPQWFKSKWWALLQGAAWFRKIGVNRLHTWKNLTARWSTKTSNWILTLDFAWTNKQSTQHRDVLLRIYLCLWINSFINFRPNFPRAIFVVRQGHTSDARKFAGAQRCVTPQHKNHLFFVNRVRFIWPDS